MHKSSFQIRRLQHPINSLKLGANPITSMQKEIRSLKSKSHGYVYH